MIWLLKHSKALYIGAVAVGVLCSLFALWSPSVFAGYCILLLAGFVLGGRWLSRETGRGIVEFYRDCDPGPLLENSGRLLAGAGDSRSERILSLRADRVAALLTQGSRNEAREELKQLESLINSDRANTTAVTVRWQRVSLALAENRLAGLEREINAVQSMAQKVQVPSLFAGITFPELVGWQAERARCLLLLRGAGPVLELLPRWKELLEKAPCTLYQVQALGDLAEYHLARGETDQAVFCLRPVAERAPRLAVGVWARETLARVEQ